MALENTGSYSLPPSFFHSPSPSLAGQRCALDTSYQGRGPFQISYSLALRGWVLIPLLWLCVDAWDHAGIEEAG